MHKNTSNTTPTPVVVKKPDTSVWNEAIEAAAANVAQALKKQENNYDCLIFDHIAIINAVLALYRNPDS